MELCIYTLLILLSLSGSLAASISGGPKLILTPPQKEYSKKIGETLFVQCAPDETVAANSVSELKWTGPHGDIPNEERVYMDGGDARKNLYIQDIKEDDKGNYTCSGRHGNGWLSTGIFLDPYLGITFEDSPTEQHATLGSQGVIKCKVVARPQAQVDWGKGSRTFSSDEDDRVIVNPGQITFNPVHKEDEGVYKCRARVPQKGDFKERIINFKVYVPPEFEDELEDQEAIEHEEMVIKCSATGTPVPSYLWTDKDNADLSDKDGFSVNKDGTLIIKEVTIEDSGKYTCVAKNEAAEVSQSFNLEVIMKPKVIRYDNTTAQEGQTTTLECEVSGKPLPEVTLRKLGSDTPFTEGLQPDGNRITLSVTDENSIRKVTLSIENVNRTDDGLYACEAVNKGGRLYQNGHITVEYSPTFENTPVNETWSWNNKKVNLTCFAEAIPNATISWVYKDYNRGGQEVSAEDLRNVQKHGNGPRSDFEVTPVDVTYFRTYTCIATNPLGEARHDMELKEARVPSNVNQAIFQSMTATTIMFKFMGVMDNGGRPVDAYAVEYKEQSKDWDEQNKKIWPIDVPYILDNLKPRVTYAFRFAARNIVGFGPYGKVHIRTMPEEGEPMKPGINAPFPDEKKVQEIDEPHSYELRWLVPEHNGKAIDYFQINVFEVDDNLDNKEGVDMRPYEIKYPGNVMYEIGGLEADHIYKIELRAHNELGFSKPTTIYIRTSSDRRTQDPSVTDGGSGAPTTTTTTPSFTQGAVAPPEGYESAPSEGIATGVIVGIVLAIVLLILVIADIICCCTNQVGLCWSIKTLMGGAGKKKLNEGKGEKEPLSNNHKDEDLDEKHDNSEPEKKPLSDDVIIKKTGSKDSLGKDTAV